jgi:hypothetical protein
MDHLHRPNRFPGDREDSNTLSRAPGIDRHHRAGDVFRAVAEEERHRAGDVVHFRQPAQGAAPRHPSALLAVEALASHNTQCRSRAIDFYTPCGQTTALTLRRLPLSDTSFSSVVGLPHRRSGSYTRQISVWTRSIFAYRAASLISSSVTSR